MKDAEYVWYIGHRNISDDDKIQGYDTVSDINYKQWKIKNSWS